MNRRRTTVKEIHHGRTTAAWTGSILAIIAIIVMSIGFLTGSGTWPSPNWTIIIVGLIILAIAPIAGGILNKMGLGQD
ncbi:HGxxPAAW family protein [Ammonicoccus fulvus]|uniref:HGxxPAAW family protein n=1 Tax=Ammonicoccus fulvus TaxID=3138240 RepID=A0ABZ3FRM1_9ACTN